LLLKKYDRNIAQIIAMNNQYQSLGCAPTFNLCYIHDRTFFAMIDHKSIPVLTSRNKDEFHFGIKKPDFIYSDKPYHIGRLEKAREFINFPLLPHRKDVYDFIIITKGTSARSKALNKYHFGKNQIFFLPAMQITEHEYFSDDIEGYYFEFDPELFTERHHLLKAFTFLQFNMSPLVTIPEGKMTPILNIMERIEQIHALPGKEHQDLVMRYLVTFFSEAQLYVEKSAAQIENNTSSVLTQRYKNKLVTLIYEKRTVSEYADLLHVTPNHLNKCVKKTINKTAQELLNEMLILEAKSLLKYSSSSISEIAHNLYDGTPSNFSRFFKKETGMTPKQFVMKKVQPIANRRESLVLD